MRTLEFAANGQVLTAPEDTSGLAAGSKNYIQCTFTFDEEWADMVKVAEFGDGRIINESVLIEDDACMVPETSTRERIWTIRLVGKAGDTYITTNTIEIRQEG